MDEFKSEDELRPYSSDRRPPRQRKGPTVPKVPVSRQHLMIGIGILVLLLLVISIGSALKSPSRTDSSRQGADNNGQRNIDLSGSTSGSDATSSSPGAPAPAANNSQTNGAPAAAMAPPRRKSCAGHHAERAAARGITGQYGRRADPAGKSG